MRLPLVTIITPSYNSERFIRETIQSVIIQDYPNIEHIIIDGSSQDNTLKIIQEYNHLKYVSEPDNGQSNAINKGFRMARGEIIGWLNADDTYNPEAVSKAVKFLNEHPNADVVYSDCQVIDDNNIRIKIGKSQPFDLMTLLEKNFIFQPTVFLHRFVVEEIGGVDESLHYCMDREFWLRINRKFKIEYNPGYISANYREHHETKTNLHRPTFFSEWLSVLENILYDTNFIEIPKPIIKEKIAQAQTRLHLAMIEDSYRRKMVKSLIQNISLLFVYDWKYVIYYPINKIKTFLGQTHR